MDYNQIENQLTVDFSLPVLPLSPPVDFYEASLAFANAKAEKATRKELNMNIDIIDVIESLPQCIQNIITAKQRTMMVAYLMKNISQ